MLWRKFLIVTDLKALVSLLNGNNKKNRTMFSRLTRWLDRLILFDFQVEHKPGAILGFADYLSRHPSSDAKPVSTYDSMFTVAKISQIRSVLGFEKVVFSKRRLESPKANNSKLVCNISNNKQPVEGERSYGGSWTNHRATNCISGWSFKSSGNLNGTIIETDFGYSNSSTIIQHSKSNLIMERKIRKLLERTPALVVAMK